MNKKYISILILGIFLVTQDVFATPTITTSTPTKAIIDTGTITTSVRFVVPLNSTNDTVTSSLFDNKYIQDKNVFTKLLTKNKVTILPGAYKVTKGMTQTQLLAVLKKKPYMVWVVIPEGLRKEEIGDLLAKTLGWTNAQKNKWITVYTKMKYDDIEGVYFPDTYLIPVAESPLDVTNRILAKFNEKFTPYLIQFNTQNIQWTTGLTFASLVQREAANDADMPLIAGILWNRLKQNMPLGVDATLQYVRGNTGKGWWAPASISDKKVDSPYNTYLHTGLPPHPISNPGIPAIEATLNPTQTDCLYYLHDKNKVIHCAATYEEHLKNIQLYLK